MSDPVIVPRAEHALSRRLVDPEALKVLYRLQQAGFTGYLVGGSVRDLLLGRKPKDFDVGTSAHPYEVKRLFRNCWIIGRRFRLAHVRFGAKTIEVATFRRLVPVDEAPAPDTPEAMAAEAAEALAVSAPQAVAETAEEALDAARAVDRLLHRDNSYGTPEQDAFRRDFTINALFYDIATFSIIDYTGGLADLRAGLLRSIGDPMVRFEEDPVRMIRAVAFAARLDFTIDQAIEEAIAVKRDDLARSAPARLIEECYKLLRSGSAEKAFRMLAERRLLEPMSAELQAEAGDVLWDSLRTLDEYRRRFESAPEALTNTILLGAVIVPLGSTANRILRQQPLNDNGKEPRVSLGLLPLARRDIDRLRQVLAFQRRLTDATLSPRARRGLIHRGPFQEAVTWMELFGKNPSLAAEWRDFALEAHPSDEADPAAPEEAAPRKRRRRRRRGGRRGPRPNAPE